MKAWDPSKQKYVHVPTAVDEHIVPNLPCSDTTAAKLRIKLSELLEDMDIPAERLRLSEQQNILWLVRNLHFRNAEHPNFEQALQILFQLRRDE